MFSVKDVCKLLRSVETIRLGWGGLLKDFDPKDEVQLNAYGDYGVNEVEVNSSGSINILISVQPIIVTTNN